MGQSPSYDSRRGPWFSGRAGPRANAKSQGVVGWQRQAESSELGDGGFPRRRTIAKTFGLDAATRLSSSRVHFWDFAIALGRGPS
jgi:hypothetical protein